MNFSFVYSKKTSDLQIIFDETTRDILVNEQEYIEITKEKFDEIYQGRLEGRVVKDDLSLSEPRPSIYHLYNGSEWVLDENAKKQGIKNKRKEVWEHIKAKRSEQGLGGVYLPKAKKWFHTDEETRTRYLALTTLSAIPEGLRWKTMDNTWVDMTKEVLDELVAVMLVQEQKNFQVAEQHKVALEKVEDPSTYDYSTGWVPTYEEYLAAKKDTTTT